ncbi:FtsX-like permease family protein [Nocardioides stalactiti]|uniref:FtsX-like permease family protein n=1 Tax=Nocardioides stalactiti TaxID=2755356 RepID=UPI001601F0C2|nr:FtsX-like permease family protein [Nocardioides stalactiti]
MLRRLRLLLWLATRWDRTDLLRVAATGAVGAVAEAVVLALLAVLAVGTDDGPYRYDVLQDASLRRGTVLALAVLVALVALLAAQCARIGATARDRRLAALRLTGATPVDVRLVVALETGISALAGSATALIATSLGRAQLDVITTAHGTYREITPMGPDTVRIDILRGQVRLLPTDVALPLSLHLIALLVTPALVTAFCVLVTRRVSVSPFGVVRLWRTEPPRQWPAACGLAGLVILSVFGGLQSAVGLADDSTPASVTIVATAMILTLAGLIAGSATCAHGLGRWIAEHTRSAGLLIASRRLEHTPYVAGRSSSVVLGVLLVGGFVLGFGEWLAVAAPPEQNSFYADTMGLVRVVLAAALLMSLVGVMISAAEAAALARPSTAGLVAAGVPRPTLRRALLVQAVLPLTLMAPGAVASGVVAARGVLGTSDTRSLGTVAHERLVVLPVEVPWLGAFALVVLAVGVATGLSMLTLACTRTDLDITAIRTTA